MRERRGKERGREANEHCDGDEFIGRLGIVGEVESARETATSG